MFKEKRICELMQSYEKALADYGFSYSSRLNHLQRVRGLMNLHEQRGLQRLDDETIAEYYREIDERFYSGKVKKNTYQSLRRMVDRFVRFVETGEVKMPNILAGCRQAICVEFETIAERYIATVPHPNTRNDARWVAHKYFAWLEEQGATDLNGVGAEHIRNYLLSASKKYSQNSMHNVRLYLSKLYAWLYESGLSESAYQELLSFPVNRNVRIQPALPSADIARMLDAIDRNTLAGKRAYAVMMLGTVLGLRACDVAKLELSNIDWINGEIKILQSKTAKTLVLPLTEDVGEALQDYILNGRLQSESKQVFLCLRRSYASVRSSVTIGEIFRDCCIAAGLPVSKRFHSLRRSFATSMVNAGVSVYDVAQALGDEDIDSTKQYIAVDTDHLKMCALPFDGIAPEGGVV